ncbi:TPA: ribbon-helix-helix protein, CopG family [Clostridioides difficile]|uniref:ribbon-helix-helix protein, CopG family n=1 Tax=Clostridioides TaxID=1870884 RepID=UPI00093DDE7E|nr:ribbon-helix-helix protein, CopG family [Clostridioides difficile]MCC0634233.1 ribbon-helix-helix protein, CopG family [Clostridioides sp. ZZV15-6388]EGT4786913.1 ribbon-helix-helix protein, CopG family [Clostridioides difficile]MCU5873414.1 ribbon-helix-helix protein, CopG family [Clostridioides difficile]MCU5897182.1 ribbon-helix-helix protein, CopG family [Clostridioides difficile]MDL5068647.1 ribbon-helix-helix protein, CopG family [Clostridioides difficile]
MPQKKMGRPTENIKDTMIRVRADKDTIDKLDECVNLLDSNRSEIIRKGIDKIYDDLKK